MDKDFVKECKKMGWSASKGIRQLGFIVNDLGASQLSYTLLYNLENFIKNNVAINPVIFFLDSMPPCIHSSVAKFNFINSFTYQGDIIATSTETALGLNNCVLAKKYFYISDINFVLNNKLNNDIIKIMQDDSIVKFTRSKDYFDLLTQKGFKVHAKIVPDLNITDLLEIING